MNTRAGSSRSRLSFGDLHWSAQLEAMTLVCVGILAVLAYAAPPGYGLPIFSTLALAAGGILGAYAWIRGLPRLDRVTVWDVSGGLLLVGFFAGILSRSDQITQMIAL